MNNLHDLLLLMFNLSQMSNKAKVIESFHESISELFKPHQFVYSEHQKPDSIYSEEISTRNFFYGYLLSDSEPTLETRRLVQNAVQMFAVILDRLNLEAELNDKVDSLETVTQKQLSEITNYAEELEIARLASLNLIEDLKEEIADRTQIEKELKESEATLAAAQQIAKMGSWDWDMISNTSKWSDEMWRVLDISPDTYDGSPDFILRVIHPDDVERVVKSMSSVSPSGILDPIEYRVIHNDGSVHNICAEGRIVFDETGRAIRNFGTVQDITERKHSEEELLKSQERFDLAMKASTDGLFDWNLETNSIYYAPAWKKMLGYEDHELPNDFSVWETTTDPEDVKNSWELQQKLISKQIDRFVLEFKMKHKDGHWVDILSRAGAIFNDSGKAIRIVGTHTDITERKLAEEALFKTTEQLEHIGKMARIGGWELDLATMQVNYSRETARIHEVDFPYVPPKLSQGNEYYPPEVWPDVQAAVQAAIEHGTAYDREWPFITAKGNRIWVRAQGFCVKENGKSIKLQGTFQDITERKQAEEEIRKQLIELRRWYEVTLDREGRVLQLKQEVNELLKQYGEPMRYESVNPDNPKLD